MGSDLKTFKNLPKTTIMVPDLTSNCPCENPCVSAVHIEEKELKEEAIKYIENLQSKDSIYPIILDKFPEEMKGEIAKDKWNNIGFRYGAEYGMIAILMHIFNIKQEDINGKD